MYPYLFNNQSLPSYIVFIFLGVLAAFVTYRILAFKTGISSNSFRFFGIAFVASIALGFVFARLFQMLYNYIETGKIGTGITFLGGLVGGVATFFAVFALFGKGHKAELGQTVSIAMPCIALGHSIGRFGCFLAGCCYGKETNAFFGIRFVEHIWASGEWIYGNARIPTQLFEALFLLLLFGGLLLIIFKLKKPELCATVYLFSYSIARFLLEFLRDDPRGAFLLGLSPSQIICLVMFVGGIILTFFTLKNKQKRLNNPNNSNNSTL